MPLYLKKNIGWFTVLLLALFPIARWFFLSPLNFRFLDINTTTTSLGQIFALLGMTLFSLNLILSSRLKFLDKYFYGLDKVYVYHRIIGAVSFCLLLFHPLFLVVKYVRFSLRAAALFLLPFSDLAISYGIFALALMIILIAVTFYLKLKYQYWKISHKFMVIVFILAILHTLYVTSDISRDNILRFYILGLAAVGLVAGLYRVILGKFLPRGLEYRIKQLNQLGRGVMEIELAPQKQKLEFLPGQFIFVSFISRGVSSEVHPFSVASAPEEENLRLVIKNLGDFTGALKNITIGDTAFIRGPFGKFSYRNVDGINQVWIAGGIGITPFLSMAKSIKKTYNYKIDLYYCTKNKGEAVLLKELLYIASNSSNFKMISWCSDESGYISGQKIFELSGGMQDKEIFICGPAGFMTSLKKQLMETGVDSKKIHWEEFKFI